ncbi:hypothetical protein BGZ54_008919, partial [Gamsiella multidivaricata]
MTVMTALGFVLRFRDMALVSYSDDDSGLDPSAPYASAEGTIISLLALVPVSAPYRFWTFATASFFERSIIQASKRSALLSPLKMFRRLFRRIHISRLVLLGSGKYLERAWGSREFFKFLAVTSVGSMLAIYFTCLFEYIVRGNEDLLYDTRVYGLTAVMAGFLIGFKQLVPEHLVTMWGIFSVRVKTLPMFFALFMIFESLITRSQVQLMLAMYGLLISWIYSRFFKIQDGIRGDRSETFSFASFFPEAA